MALTRETLDELAATYSSKFEDTMTARIDGAHKAIRVEDDFGSTGYAPFITGGVGVGREWIGARVFKKVQSYGVRFIGKLYENTVKVPVVDLEDDPALSAAKIATAQTRSAARHDEIHTFGVLKNNQVGFDNVPLFGEHSYLADDGTTVIATYNNDIAGTSSAWYLCNDRSIVVATRRGEDYTGQALVGTDLQFNEDAVAMGWRARKIFAPGFWADSVRSKKALTPENLDEAIQLAHSFKSDDGQPIDNAPKFLVVPRSLESAARKLIKAELVNGGETNIYFNRLQVIVSDDL